MVIATHGSIPPVLPRLVHYTAITDGQNTKGSLGTANRAQFKHEQSHDLWEALAFRSGYCSHQARPRSECAPGAMAFSCLSMTLVGMVL